MRSAKFASLAAFAVGSSASALIARNITNASCVIVYNSTAIADCSFNVISYATMTVTPSAATITETVNVVVTALTTSTETDVFSSTLTSIISSTELGEYLSTVLVTSTDVQTLTMPVTDTLPVVTATSTITVTSASVSTYTSFYPTATVAVVAKRDTEEEDDECEIDEPEPSSTVVPTTSNGGFVTSTTQAPAETFASTISSISYSSFNTTTIKNQTATASVPVSSSSTFSTIPVYASACTTWAEYVAACSTAGITQTTSTISVTLPASTDFVTVSSTSIITLTEISTTEITLSFTTFSTVVTSTIESITLTIPVHTTATETAYTTETASASTTIVYQTVTVSGPATIETITTPIPTFKLQMTPLSGSGTTYYMKVAAGDGIAYTSTTDVSLASTFTVDTLNRLVTTAADPEIACVYNTIANYYMEGIRQAWLTTHPQYFTALTCTVNNGLTLTCVHGAANAFTYVASQQSFFYSVAGYAGYPTCVANLIVQ